jgi:hypothetical protein
MSMTYFSSLNMIKALRTVSAQDTVMAALADVHSQRAVGFVPPAAAGGSSSQGGGGGSSLGKQQFIPDPKRGQLSGQEALRVSAWSVDDVAKWLQTLSLGQYSESFNDAAIDGEFLFDLNDDDLKNTLGIEHRLHRKKILNCVHRLKVAEAQKDSRLNDLLRESGSLDPPVPFTSTSTYSITPYYSCSCFLIDRLRRRGPQTSTKRRTSRRILSNPTKARAATAPWTTR